MPFKFLTKFRIPVLCTEFFLYLSYTLNYYFTLLKSYKLLIQNAQILMFKNVALFYLIIQ